MAGRIRSIKPEILDDEKCAALSHLEYRLFVGSWLIADDYGNLRGDPDYVRGQIVWGSRESRDTVAKALEGLARVSLLIPYTVRGQSYLHVAGWDRHQRVDKPGKPRMPGMDEDDSQSSQTHTLDSRESREDFAGVSRESRGSLAPDLRPPTSDLDLESRPPRAPAIPQTTQPGTTPAQSFAQRDWARERARGALAEATWQRLSELRVAHASKLRLSGVLPFPLITPGSNPRGFRELQDRIREEGERAHEVCDHVLRVLDKQAGDGRSIEWLAEKAFLAGPWAKARETAIAKRKPAVAAPASVPTTLTADDRAGAAEVLASFLGKETA